MATVRTGRVAIAGVVCALVLPTASMAQEEVLDYGTSVVLELGTATVSKHWGGSVRITRGFGAISARSSLVRNWYVVNNPALGIVFEQGVGARGEEDGGSFYYRVAMRMHALEEIKAFEVIVLTFDVWNEHERTLVFSQLEDLGPDQIKEFDRAWGPYWESDLRSFRTSIVYVSKVMKADGSVVIADEEPALAAARLIEEDFTAENLAPSKDERGDPGG